MPIFKEKPLGKVMVAFKDVQASLGFSGRMLQMKQHPTALIMFFMCLSATTPEVLLIPFCFFLFLFNLWQQPLIITMNTGRN